MSKARDTRDVTWRDVLDAFIDMDFERLGVERKNNKGSATVSVTWPWFEGSESTITENVTMNSGDISFVTTGAMSMSRKKGKRRWIKLWWKTAKNT